MEGRGEGRGKARSVEGRRDEDRQATSCWAVVAAARARRRGPRPGAARGAVALPPARLHGQRGSRRAARLGAGFRVSRKALAPPHVHPSAHAHAPLRAASARPGEATRGGYGEIEAVVLANARSARRILAAEATAARHDPRLRRNAGPHAADDGAGGGDEDQSQPEGASHERRIIAKAERVCNGRCFRPNTPPPLQTTRLYVTIPRGPRVARWLGPCRGGRPHVFRRSGWEERRS